MCHRIFKYQTTESGDIPFFKIGSFGGTPDAFISKDLFESFKVKYPYPEKGDVLISASGSIGRTVVFTGKDEYFQDSNIVWLKHNNNIINSFLNYLYSIVKWAGIEGSTIKRLYNDNILKTEAIIPTLLEQQKISDYLDGINHLITLHQRKLEKLKIIKKSMLENLFPQNGEKTPKIRFSGFTEDWEQRKLGEIVKEVNRVDENSNAPVMMITANDGFIEQSERYSTDNAGKSLKKYILLKKWELAYNHGASKIRPFGSCFALTRAANIRIPFVYHCFLALEDNPEFLEYTLNSKNVENQLRKIVSSGARMDGLLNISFQEYTSIFIRCPIRKEQDIIAILIKSLDHIITLHQSKLEKLQKIKKSMLESMFV